MEDNSTSVLIRFINDLTISVSKQTIIDELQRHPDFDSLAAFSDVLDSWHIPNAAYQLSFEELNSIPLPFIAFYEGRTFVVVSEFDEKHVVISNEKWNNRNVPAKDFKIYYSGSVLIAEKAEGSGEIDYKRKKRKEQIHNLRTPVLIIGSLIVLLSYLLSHIDYVNTFNLRTCLLVLFKTSALTTSVLLLMQSIDTNNPLIQRLCGSANKNCNAVLSSKASRISEELSWSEVGFFYFSGTWLILLFNADNIPLMQTLAILNLISLPYTFYSIYYQWRVYKQWCVLCCAIQVFLWLEFFTFLPYLSATLSPLDLDRSSILIRNMAIPILLWIIIKPYLLRARQIYPLKQQLRQFKYNTGLFQKMLNDEVKYTLPEDEHSLIMGNPKAEKVITMVSNPYCQPCAKAHRALDELLSGRNDIKLQIIFSTKNDERDRNTEIAAHLMSLKNIQNNHLIKNAMNDWYEQKQKSYISWAKLYPVKKNHLINKSLEVQIKWCQMAEIQATPTIFINGRILPKLYQSEDLKYFV